MGVKLGEAFVEVSARLDKLESGLQQAEGKTQGFASRAGGFLKNALSFTVGGAILQGVNAVTNSIGGLISGMVSGNAEFEQYQQRFEVLLKSADGAKQRLAELADFGAKTPFDLPEVVRADTVLQGFGLHAEDTAKRFGFSGAEIRRIAGDVASGSGASFEQIAGYLGKFSAGATGEAIMRFQELGITTRSELTKMGVQFSKAGELVTPVDQAFSIMLKLMNQKYDGMMAKQSKTFTGMLSNLRDWTGKTLRIVGQPIFEKLKGGLESLMSFLDSPAVQDAINTFAGWIGTGIDGAITTVTNLVKTLKESPIAKTIGGMIGDIKSEGLGGAIGKWLSGAIDTIKDPTKRQALINSIGQTVADISDKAVTWYNDNIRPYVDALGERILSWVQGAIDYAMANNARVSLDLGAMMAEALTQTPQSNPFTALQGQVATWIRQFLVGLFDPKAVSPAVELFFVELNLSLTAGMLGFIERINQKFGTKLGTDKLRTDLVNLQQEADKLKGSIGEYNAKATDKEPQTVIGAQTEEASKLTDGWYKARDAVRAYIAEINRIPPSPPPPRNNQPPNRPPGRGEPEGTGALPNRAPVSIVINAAGFAPAAVTRAALTAVDLLRARGAI